MGGLKEALEEHQRSKKRPDRKGDSWRADIGARFAYMRNVKGHEVDCPCVDCDLIREDAKGRDPMDIPEMPITECVRILNNAVRHSKIGSEEKGPFTDLEKLLTRQLKNIIQTIENFIVETPQEGLQAGLAGIARLYKFNGRESDSPLGGTVSDKDHFPKCLECIDLGKQNIEMVNRCHEFMKSEKQARKISHGKPLTRDELSDLEVKLFDIQTILMPVRERVEEIIMGMVSQPIDEARFETITKSNGEEI